MELDDDELKATNKGKLSDEAIKDYEQTIIELYEEMQRYRKMYFEEKENNKKLDTENQALYESINCNDDEMLIRQYKKLKVKNSDLELRQAELNGLVDIVKKDYVHKNKIKEIIEELYQFCGEDFDNGIVEDYLKEELLNE